MKSEKINLEKTPPNRFNSRFRSEASAGNGINKIAGFDSSAGLEAEINEIQSLIDEGVSRRAEEKAEALLKLKPRDADVLARIRLCVSKALELQARYREALDALKKYEDEESLARLEPKLKLEVQTQTAILYNYLTDSPKAVSFLKEILEEATAIEA